ncbi:MAG: acyl-ACP--UDP-N-acetylglucosamine O-acyltransferase [Vicinamibacterales bacterium]|jgi:UDP-N-acetylglucosamine acyltransferase|nr:acyl-[acyl-carrier-protein]--UDP-N-acetylglucosamine O-acyltransferase [Acidobacteriota bacterium]MDP7293934.1 acyl-ACP--UDP-N-acetylglucosamine O-acyltransferase [Vicinamibacterales bacterium]MDP7473344.1 acyl-ACP--UDP-N-acetylglucosamine O-acyltransferase [Vicinamibacterales bacterium]MDP7670801.1 acyl-ACP--UDP-N-acetylglucosamine O-acyltransferase [Vicinamibacterales bacterium]HJO37808.1 acyl-ACP--UDP-N-acetylglucosamine O-acyltransferase [Vicinamibacterales bacterium]
MAQIHPGAFVDAGAKLADDVVVGPGAVIEAGVAVGARGRVGPHAVLHRGTTLADEVTVAVGAVIGGAPQDVKFSGGESGVTIGPQTVIREYATVHRCSEPGAVTRVGADCMLMATSHVAHECVLGDGVILANGATLAGHVTLADGVFVSGHAQIHQFVRAGPLVMIGGGSKVLKDLPPYCVADGHPARLFGLNSIGLRRAAFAPERVQAIKEAYRTLFGAGVQLEAALTSLDRLGRNGNPSAAEFAAFVRASERGIARPGRSGG